MQRELLVEFSCNPHSLLDSPLESFTRCEIICPWVMSGCYNRYHHRIFQENPIGLWINLIGLQRLSPKGGILSYASPPVQKLHPHGKIISQNIQACLLPWPPFLQHVLWQCCNHLGIPSFIVEILLFNSVFHDGVTPVSVSTLKPPLGVIEVLPLKPWASPILSICI